MEKLPETKTENTKRGERRYEFKIENFNIYEELKKINFPFIEVGGVTEDGYSLVDIEKLNKKLLVSDVLVIDPDNEYINDEKFKGRYGKIHFLADAAQLPFKKESIGAIFTSCLYFYLRSEAIKETAKVLVDGGFLIWQGGTKKDLKDAKKTI